MVRLSKIYTRTGDAGETMLGDGTTVPKTSPRVEAYGSVDEANAAIGIAIAALAKTHAEIAALLELSQHDLFDVGADLCVPIGADEAPGQKLRVQQGQVDRLEAAIDRFNEPLSALESFVLPGGEPAAAQLHLARTLVRRAERAVADLRAIDDERDRTNGLTLVYLNRLSDLLFVLARAVNAGGAGDVLWIPGASRT